MAMFCTHDRWPGIRYRVEFGSVIPDIHKANATGMFAIKTMESFTWQVQTECLTCQGEQLTCHGVMRIVDSLKKSA